jgi:class 3 adenylate cyclase
MTIDYDAMTLTELIKLQDDIEREIRARYEKPVTLVFTDVVGSTAYFERFGDAAGRALLQRHLDMLDNVMSLHQGRVVDTAGDGAFCTFERLLPGVLAMSELQSMIAADNGRRSSEQRMGLRIGIHAGEVLTDGVIVTGDAVHMAARVSNTANAGEIHLTQTTMMQLPPAFRVRCKPLPAARLKGFAESVPLASLEWRDSKLFPTQLHIVETDQTMDMPPGDTIRFGRLEEHEGKPANEIVLAHPDPQVMRRISRWHFELHRRSNGMFLRVVSRANTEVDGKVVSLGEEVQVKPGANIRIGWVLTMRLLSPAAAGAEETIIG